MQTFARKTFYDPVVGSRCDRSAAPELSYALVVGAVHKPRLALNRLEFAVKTDLMEDVFSAYSAVPQNVLDERSAEVDVRDLQPSAYSHNGKPSIEEFA